MTLGSPHPGWRWYGVALGCLILALLSVLLIPFWQNYWQALRLFHAPEYARPGRPGRFGNLARPDAYGFGKTRSGGRQLVAPPIVAGGFRAPCCGDRCRDRLAVRDTRGLLILVCALGLAGHWSRRFGLKAVLMDGVAASCLLP
jgi:hypothetical protein